MIAVIQVHRSHERNDNCVSHKGHVRPIAKTKRAAVGVKPPVYNRSKSRASVLSDGGVRSKTLAQTVGF